MEMDSLQIPLICRHPLFMRRIISCPADDWICLGWIERRLLSPNKFCWGFSSPTEIELEDLEPLKKNFAQGDIPTKSSTRGSGNNKVVGIPVKWRDLQGSHVAAFLIIRVSDTATE